MKLDSSLRNWPFDQGAWHVGALLCCWAALLGNARGQETNPATNVTPEVASASLGESLTNAPGLSTNALEVFRLAESGAESDDLVAFVRASPEPFSLTPADLVYLRDQGLEDPIIEAMQQADQQLKEQPSRAGAPPLRVTPAVVRRMSPVPAAPPAPPVSVTNAPPDVTHFYEPLAPYGTWAEFEGLGWGWQPRAVNVHRNWHPYRHRGRWIYTNFGWHWQSDYSWGWAAFHYGRWYQHPHVGWIWFPDRIWAPAWVTWRHSDTHCGWAPLPPRSHYVVGQGWTFEKANVGPNFGFGLNSGAYTFVETRHLPEFAPHLRALPPERATEVFGRTVVRSEYGNRDNIFINLGLPQKTVENACRHPIPPVYIRPAAASPMPPMKPERTGFDGFRRVIYRPQFQPLPALVPVSGPRIDPSHPELRMPPLGSAPPPPTGGGGRSHQPVPPGRALPPTPARGVPPAMAPRPAPPSGVRPVPSAPPPAIRSPAPPLPSRVPAAASPPLRPGRVPPPTPSVPSPKVPSAPAQSPGGLERRRSPGGGGRAAPHEVGPRRAPAPRPAPSPKRGKNPRKHSRISAPKALAARPGAEDTAGMKTPTLPPCDYQPQPYTGPSADEVLAIRKQFLNPAIFHYYKKPLLIVEGKGQWLFDEKGRRYLDGFGGIVTVSVGHCHPHVVAAVNAQNELIQHTTTIYLHPNIALYARDLAAKMPGELKVVYFVNSGSEANDLALLMARAHTGNYDVIALRNAYHGGSQSTMGLTSHHTWKFNVPHSFGFQHALMPDTYRGPYGADDPEAGRKYADDVKNLIQFGTSGQVAGFIAESIQGVGGTVVFPDGYLKRAYEHIRAAGGVCIADEVQSGFGRTGTHFWGFETQGVVPDLVTMAKGIGNGCPLAAVVTTPAIAKSLASRIHFNTFGGNPVVCAQGRAVLEVIEREGLQANSLKVGHYLKAGLVKLAGKHSLIGEVRGLGLMLGVELVKDRRTKEPAKDECAFVFETCKDLGLLIGKGGLWGNTLRIKPPMCITTADADFLLAVLDAALQAA